MRNTINVAIGIDLEMEAVPLCICVEVHQAIAIPPAGIQQRRGVGKGEGSLQATEYQQCVLQAAVGTGLRHGSPLVGICNLIRLCASRFPLVACVWSVNPQIGSLLFCRGL